MATGGRGGGYPHAQIPAGGSRGGYPHAQIPAGGSRGGYPNAQIPAGGRGGYPYAHIPAGGRGGGYTYAQILAGGRGGGYTYAQIPGKAISGYLSSVAGVWGLGGLFASLTLLVIDQKSLLGFPVVHLSASQEKRFECETVAWYKIPIYQGVLRIREEIKLDPDICYRLEEAYQQKLNEVSFMDKESRISYTAFLDKYVLYLTGNHLPLAHLKRVEREANRVRNTALDRSLSPQASYENKEPSNTKEGQRMVEKYKGLASKLIVQLNSALNWIVQSDFPVAFMEIKAKLVEIGRFRTEDVPTWVEERKEILRIYNNLQNYGISPLTIEERLGPDKINHLWTKLESAMLDRQGALEREMAKLEGLQHLLERIEKEAHNLEGRLYDLERHIGGGGKQLNAAKSTEGKQKSVLEGELKDINDHVTSLINDVQVLPKAGFSDSHKVLNRVLSLMRRTGHVRTALDSIGTKKPPPEPSANKVVMTAQHQKSSEGVQMVEIIPVLCHVEFCLQWINKKHALLEVAEYGNRLDSVKQALDQHQKEQEDIISFKTEVDKCMTDMKNLTLEEQQQYEEWFSDVQIMYPALYLASCQRQQYLVSLQDFLKDVTSELNWMGEKQQFAYEYSRRLDEFSIPDEQIFKTLVQEITSREAMIKSVQDRGYTMIIEKHPATETVEVYVSRTESKWSWLQQLLKCLDKHIHDVHAYHQFFQEVQSCEQWIVLKTESVCNFKKHESLPFEKLEQTKIECQDLQNALVEYEGKVAFLAKTSKDIIPLKQRNHQVTSPVKVYSLCIYEHPNIPLKLQEECSLLDNSKKIRWLVRNTCGQQDTVPSIGLMIPPPNFEAIAHADRLKTCLEHLKSLVKAYDRKLTENIVMSIIEFIKTWDLRQFQSLGPTSCKVLQRDLNDRAAKLVAEGGEADQKMQLQLEKDLDECNRKVQEFSKKLCEEARTVAPGSFSKEVKRTFCQSQEKSKQLMVQLPSDAQDHVQSAEQDIRKKLEAVKESENLLIIPSVFGSGTATINPGVVSYMEANHILDDQLKAMEEQYGLKSQRNGYIMKLSGQADELLSSAKLLLHDIKRSKVPNEDTESRIPQKYQEESFNAWRNKEVDGTSALIPEKTDVPGSYPSNTDLSEVDQENSIAYTDCKTEVAEDVLNSIKITYGQKGIDSLISDLEQFAKVDTCEGRILVFCDYKHAENVQRCVKSHHRKAKRERKTREENKHFIYGGNDNLKEWLQFAYGHTGWSKNLQLEGGKLYLLGSVQMKKEVEKAIQSMNHWYQEEFTLSSEEQQKADAVVAMVKNELPAIFIKQTRETIAVLSDNKDNVLNAKNKVKVALGRIKITSRERGRRDPQAYGESFLCMSKDNMLDASPKFPLSGFQTNQPTAVLAPKSYCIKEGLTAKVYLGNITSLPVDCIVNAASRLLMHGCGVALVISKAAGRDYDEEGEVYVRNNGPIPVTRCCVTSAGKLPYKVVIHAVGPQWSEYKDNQKERCGDDLKKTIVNCLIEADKFKMASIAIPPLSSGIFGVPNQLCAQMYAKGVVEYSKTYGLQSVKEIHFVYTISEMCQLTQSAFDKELQCN